VPGGISWGETAHMVPPNEPREIKVDPAAEVRAVAPQASGPAVGHGPKIVRRVTVVELVREATPRRNARGTVGQALIDAAAGRRT
jgi:hypothetical protein